MKRRRLFKAIAFLLAFVMLLSMMPVTALETETTTGETSIPEAEAAVPSVGKEPNPDYVEESQTREVTERREANVKHFRLEDGSYEAVAYGYPVHRKDADGEWQDIDNRLLRKVVGGKTVYATTDSRVTFANQTGNGDLMTLSENGYTIRMGYLPPSNTVITASQPAAIANHASRAEQLQAISPELSEAEKLEQLHRIDNTTSVVYESVQQGINLKYVLQANDIKEYIVVEAPQSAYVYRFGLLLEGLEAELTEQGDIILRDAETDEEPYTIPAPFMVDANNAVSTAVCYELEQIGDGAYILTVEADAAWFGQAERAYPVMIDPTIQQRAHTDTYITAANPNSAPYTEAVLWVGTNKITYIRPSLNSIPQGSIVDFATISVAYYFPDNVVDGTINVGIYQVNQYWTSSLTWNKAISMSNYGLSTSRLSYRTLRGDLGAYASSPKWQSFVITDAVHSWLNGSTNNGIAIKRESGTLFDVALYSVNSGTTYAPYFIIFYTEPVEEGVYRLRSAYNGLYLTTAGTYYKTGAPLQQSSKLETVDGKVNQAQLFKISYIRSYGYDQYYDIRPMTNSALGLDAPITGTDRSVKANTIATTDEWFDIPQTQRWVIETDGYSGNNRRVTLQNAFSDNGGYLTAPSSITSGEAITTTTTPTLKSEWYLEPYTGESIDGIIGIGIKKTITVGDELTYNSYMYSSTVGRNGPVIYSVANLDNSNTDKATVNSQTGELTALKAGTIKLRVTYSGAPTTWYWTIDILPRYTYTISHYYDQGYNVRFSNAFNKIRSYQEVCSDIFLEVFSLGVTSYIYFYSSCADDCKGVVNATNLTNSCGHVPTHLTTSAIRNDLISQCGNGTNVHSRVAWSGHLLNNNPSSNSSSSSYTIVITILHTTDSNHNNRTESEVRKQSIYTLLHETSHQLGAPDHYCYGDESNGPNNKCSNPSRDCWRCDNCLPTAPNCVMTYRNYSLEEKLNNGTIDSVYCDQCKSDGEKGIPYHIANHH